MRRLFACSNMELPLLRCVVVVFPIIHHARLSIFMTGIVWRSSNVMLTGPSTHSILLLPISTHEKSYHTLRLHFNRVALPDFPTHIHGLTEIVSNWNTRISWRWSLTSWSHAIHDGCCIRNLGCTGTSLCMAESMVVISISKQTRKHRYENTWFFFRQSYFAFLNCLFFSLFFSCRYLLSLAIKYSRSPHHISSIKSDPQKLP